MEEKAKGAPRRFEYSEEVEAILSELFSVSDVDFDSAKFNEKTVEKVMQELLGEMNGSGLGSAEQVAKGEDGASDEEEVAPVE